VGEVFCTDAQGLLDVIFNQNHADANYNLLMEQKKISELLEHELALCEEVNNNCVNTVEMLQLKLDKKDKENRTNMLLSRSVEVLLIVAIIILI
jgi:hypothetical protein